MASDEHDLEDTSSYDSLLHDEKDGRHFGGEKFSRGPDRQKTSIVWRGLKGFWYLHVMLTTGLSLYFIYCTFRSHENGTLWSYRRQLDIGEDMLGIVPQCMYFRAICILRTFTKA